MAMQQQCPHRYDLAQRVANSFWALDEVLTKLRNGESLWLQRRIGVV
jgi:hypothetical protein